MESNIQLFSDLSEDPPVTFVTFEILVSSGVTQISLGSLTVYLPRLFHRKYSTKLTFFHTKNVTISLSIS